MKINFARLNHVFIPARKEGRDRWRQSRLGRAARPFFYFYETLTPEGNAFALGTVISAALGLDVASTDLHVVAAGLLGLLVASLLLARRYRLRGVELSVEVARRVAVGEEAAFVLRCKNNGEEALGQLRFLGPFLPWDGRWTAPPPGAPALPAGAEARVCLRARFSERGEHHLDPFRVARLAPLGLAQGPSLHTAGCRFLVVPRPANVLRVASPPGQRHQPGGVALASKTGESMDLLGVRPYRPGDPVRDLHARSWARAGHPVVREYQQEYFSRVGVVLDTDVGRADPDLLEGAISLAAGLLLRLCQGEALIDLLVLGSQLHPLLLGRSLGTYEQALDLLACVAPGPPLRAEELLGALRPHLGRLSCVFFIGLRWDEARARLCAELRAGGAACQAVFVDVSADDGPAPAAAQRVPLAAIVAGEPLRIGA